MGVAQISPLPKDCYRQLFFDALVDCPANLSGEDLLIHLNRSAVKKRQRENSDIQFVHRQMPGSRYRHLNFALPQGLDNILIPT
jgi:hypothetical protein